MPYCEKCGKQLSDDAMFCAGCGAQQNNKSLHPPAQSDHINNSGHFKRGNIIASAYSNYNSVRRFKIAEIFSVVCAAIFWFLYYSDYNDSALILAIISTVEYIFFSYAVYLYKSCYIHMYENCISGKAVRSYLLRSFEVPYCSIVDARVIRNKKDDVLQLTIKNNFSNIQDIFSLHIVDPCEILKQIQIKTEQ